MKALSVLYIMVGCIAAGILGYHIYQLVILTANPVTINLNGQSLGVDDAYYGELTDLLILGKRFASAHDYSVNYSCVNFSDDFERIALELGFDVETESACRFANMTECHQYNVVRVPYEPQSGEFRDMSADYPYKREPKFKKIVGGDE